MNSMIPLILAVGTLAPSQIPFAESSHFSKDLQSAVITATVRIRQSGQGKEGSGVLVGKSGSFVYILTARHVVAGADRLEVDVFARESYPNVSTVYRVVNVVAETGGTTDLALLRLTTTDPMPGFLRLCPEQKAPKEANVSAMAAGCEAGKAPTGLLDKTVTKKMARRPEDKEVGTFWEMNASRDPGNSGGPLIDKRGYLIGICSGTNLDKTYFTHHGEIFAFLKRNGFRWIAEEKGEK